MNFEQKKLIDEILVFDGLSKKNSKKISNLFDLAYLMRTELDIEKRKIISKKFSNNLNKLKKHLTF